MSLLTQLNVHVFWRVRELLNMEPGTTSEGIWRHRRLRRSPPGKPGRIQWERRPLAYADGQAVLGQLHEIFSAGCYDFVSANSHPRIIDCGAHVGCAVLRWRHRYPGARITAIEADPAIAALLRENLRAWQDEATEVINAAVWNESGEIRFSATGADNGNVAADGAQTIPALDLAGLCGEPVDLLKLDIEGSEAVVLSHLASTGALRNVRALVCEWHEWGPAAPRLHEALAQITAAGLTYRIVQAYALGDGATAVFPHMRSPGNQLMIYAWQE